MGGRLPSCNTVEFDARRDARDTVAIWIRLGLRPEKVWEAMGMDPAPTLTWGMVHDAVLARLLSEQAGAKP